ncbi:glycosyltransferase family 4 protein [Nostoc sp.]|uniref:glycosyltransferase family 4 protein n=1 Tax=Nostoc sp. TaxID=1180 RepID=UPI002FFB13E8
MIFLYYDSWGGPGGVATYIHALAIHLQAEKIPFQVVVSESQPSPLADELAAKGIKIYRQPKLPGERWQIRKRIMLLWLKTQLKPGDWVFCVCQPEPAIYLNLVQIVHRCGAKIAVSWMFTPEFWPLSPRIVGSYAKQTQQAIIQTDAVVSVSHCSVHQFKEMYGYTGKVHVIPLHNLTFFSETVPLPSAPPWKIGFMGRLDIQHKNLDVILQAFAILRQLRQDVELHLYGGGSDRETLEHLTIMSGIQDSVYFHGAYDHRCELHQIISTCHFFIYPSRWEGGPCFSLLELVQAGRYCVAAAVGGIPDLYAGHPDVGLLLDSPDADTLFNGFVQTLKKFETNLIDANKIRARYFDGFDMESAHRAWISVIQSEAVV